MNPEERFAKLVEEFADSPDVEAPAESAGRRFGSDALKVGGSIFAMLRNGRLVVKLPRDRVQALIDRGAGVPFEAGKGRPMKQWLTVVADDDDTWSTLGREALEFVRGQ